MNKIIIDQEKGSKNKYIYEWFLKMLGYTGVLIFISFIFNDTVYIDKSYWWLWGFIAVIIINLLNTFIKPLLIVLTLPLTIVTLGFFYPIINVIILYMVDFILGRHFELGNIIMVLMVAFIISIMNGIVDKIIFNRKGS